LPSSTGSIADDIELDDGPMAQFHRAPLIEAVSHLRSARGESSVLLEVGCGAGGVTGGLTALGLSVAGLDVDADAIFRARAELENVPLIRGDAHSIPISDCSVAGVLSVSMLQYVDWSLVLAECHRILEPGGTAVFIENLRSNPLVGLYRVVRRLAWAFPVLKRIGHDKRPVRHLTWAMRHDFAALFDSVEFSAHHVLTPLVLAETFLVPGRWSPSRLNRRLFGVLSAVDRRLLLRVPGLWRLAWIVVVTVRKRQ
jgi:SAM-dependent methyltransferase